MLGKRIDTLKKKLRNPPASGKIDIQPRHPALLALEGWYETNTNTSTFPRNYRSYFTEYKRSGSALKFTKWLSKKTELDNGEISKIGNLLQTVKFKISCRHKDLLRLSETKHYTSCFKQWRGIQQLRYLADPDIGVVFVPDASGKYLWRALVRLIIDPQDSSKFALVFYKAYGNSNDVAIYEKLNQIIPIYQNILRSFRRNDGNIVYSASEVKNVIISRHVWSDHWCGFDYTTNRLMMCCDKWVKSNSLSLRDDIPF